MADHTFGAGRSLRIMHVLRAPLGGLYRHVLDLAQEQIARGHSVGIIADAMTGGDSAIKTLQDIEPQLALGLSRVAMRRHPDLSDVRALNHVLQRFEQTTPDVIHGHGSKGGAFARMAGFPLTAPGVIRVYTPHGGSLNYSAGRLAQSAYMAIERALAWRTDLLLFESAFIADRYCQRVSPPRGLARVVHNGIGACEFKAVAPKPDAADFLYVGELRAAKGVDTLIDALALAGVRMGRRPSAVLVGSGPETEALKARAARVGLADRIEFAGLLPARRAFERGRILIVPSRAESLPYIVLEAAAAHLPMIASNVGGIPEVFGPYRDNLVAPDAPGALAERMIHMMTLADQQRAEAAFDLARHVQDKFSVESMVDGIIDAYRDAMARQIRRRAPARPEIAVSA